MLLSAVSVLVVAQSSSEIPEGLMNNPVYARTMKVDYLRVQVGRATCEACSGNLEVSGTIPAFALVHRETKKTLYRDGRSQDLSATSAEVSQQDDRSHFTCSPKPFRKILLGEETNFEHKSAGRNAASCVQVSR